MLSLGFFLLSTKEMGTNEVLLLQAASNKMPKDTNIIIISFLSCLIYVNTGLSLGLVAFYAECKSIQCPKKNLRYKRLL